MFVCVCMCRQNKILEILKTNLFLFWSHIYITHTYFRDFCLSLPSCTHILREVLYAHVGRVLRCKKLFFFLFICAERSRPREYLNVEFKHTHTHTSSKDVGQSLILSFFFTFAHHTRFTLLG